MDDLISRKKLLSTLAVVAKKWAKTDAEQSLMGRVLYIIEHKPEEVVRCEDCKHRREDEDYVCGHYCVKRPHNGGYFCEDNDFCSYGERKGGDGDDRLPEKALPLH